MSGMLRAMLIAALLLAAGCADTYVLTTTDGRRLLSDGEPEYDEERRVYVFEDEDGHDWIIPEKEVKSIRED